jgi:hypothetical protein
MLTTNNIIAHKKVGKNLVWITQVDSSYFLIFAQVVKNSSIKILAEKKISYEEMLVIYQQLTSKILALGTGVQQSTEIFLLEAPKTEEIYVKEKESFVRVVSPYYPTKEIFLSTQMTGAPNVK